MSGESNGTSSHPGKPIENAYIESFNARFRDECLNENWFINLAEARQKIEAWRQDYNLRRPHSALGYRTPEEFRQLAMTNCGNDVGCARLENATRLPRSQSSDACYRDSHLLYM